MSVANEVKARLDALGTLGPITVGKMIETTNLAGAIYEYGGRSGIRQFGVAGIKYERPSIQIVFRGEPEDYGGPRTRAEIAMRNLAEIQVSTLGSTNYLQADPQQSPFPTQPQDGNKRFYIGFNLYITKELS